MNETKSDIWVKCACGKDFLFSVRDQEFYEKNNYLPPKRCRECRKIRQQEREKYQNYQRKDY